MLIQNYQQSWRVVSEAIMNRVSSAMMEGLAVSPHLDRWPSAVLMATHGHPEKTPVVLSCFPPWVPEGPATPVKFLPGSRCSGSPKKSSTLYLSAVYNYRWLQQTEGRYTVGSLCHVSSSASSVRDPMEKAIEDTDWKPAWGILFLPPASCVSSSNFFSLWSFFLSRYVSIIPPTFLQEFKKLNVFNA